jgi:hypothetical protein
MRVSVAKLIVPVALFAAAAPAFAAGPLQVERAEVNETAFHAGIDQNIHNGYWSASSEYYVSPRGTVATSNGARPVRRVLITGYHPVEGFEAEIAKEEAEAARH